MTPSHAANIVRAAFEISQIHRAMGELRARIGQLSDQLGGCDVSWSLQAKGKGPTLTIGGDAAGRMLELALASLRAELKAYDDQLAAMPPPMADTPPGE